MGYRTWNATWKGHVITVEESVFSNLLCVDGVLVDANSRRRRLSYTLESGDCECEHVKRPGASFCPLCGNKLDSIVETHVVVTLDSRRIQIYAGGKCVLDQPR